MQSRRAARGIGVGKAHIVKAQLAFHVGNREVLAFVGNIDRCLQERHRPVNGRHGALVHIGNISQPSQRPQQTLGQKHQHRIRAHRQLALNRQPTAIQQRGRKPRQDGSANHRCDGGAEANGAGVGCAIAIAGLGDMVSLYAFRGECLDGGQPQQVVIELGADIASGSTHFGVTRSQPLLKPECAEQNGGDRQQGNHRNTGLQ